ncbi:hypothetical protein ACFS07_25075 [Undibacterium arcticum]
MTGSDGAVRYSYVGDLQGNLWRFDFTGDAPWSGALPGNGTPLFYRQGWQWCAPANHRAAESGVRTRWRLCRAVRHR